MIRGNFEPLSISELNDITNKGDNLDKLIETKPDAGSWESWVQENQDSFDRAQELDRQWISSSLYSSLDFRTQCIKEGFKILNLYPVYHQGWECDYWGAVGEKDSKTYLLETNHGGLVTSVIDPSKIKKESMIILKIE